MNKLDKKRQAQVVAALVEGASIASRRITPESIVTVH